MDEDRGDRTSGAAHFGYLLAIFLPGIGLLMGLALVAQGDDDGPWVVGLAILANVLYGIALYIALT